LLEYSGSLFLAAWQTLGVDSITVAILACLSRVEAQRLRLAGDASLLAKTSEVKRYQHSRFGETYSDLLHDPVTAPAARFFLDELYGPQDFSLRDDQFRRIVPSLNRFFPREVTGTVLELAKLHALSEELDVEMAARWSQLDERLSAKEYQELWVSVDRADLRAEQLRLMLSVGLSVDKLARKPFLRSGLKLMRGPASAAGFGALQAFLEDGLTAFRKLRSPELFLETIVSREQRISKSLFDGSKSLSG
jgi:hypothetical protein